MTKAQNNECVFFSTSSQSPLLFMYSSTSLLSSTTYRRHYFASYLAHISTLFRCAYLHGVLGRFVCSFQSIFALQFPPVICLYPHFCCICTLVTTLEEVLGAVFPLFPFRAFCMRQIDCCKFTQSVVPTLSCRYISFHMHQL